MKNAKSAYIMFTNTNKHPVTFMQVRNYLRQMELLYQDCEEEEFMKHIVQVLPTVVEMLNLKWSILNYQKRTKQYLALGLN